MNDIKLSHPFCPTQEPSVERNIQPEVFTPTFEDDNGDRFKVLVTYHYFEYRGDNYLVEYNYRVVYPKGFVPTMRPACLADDVRDAIKGREEDNMIFTEAKDITLTVDLT